MGILYDHQLPQIIPNFFCIAREAKAKLLAKTDCDEQFSSCRVEIRTFALVGLVDLIPVGALPQRIALVPPLLHPGKQHNPRLGVLIDRLASLSRYKLTSWPYSGLPRGKTHVLQPRLHLLLRPIRWIALWLILVPILTLPLR